MNDDSIFEVAASTNCFPADGEGIIRLYQGKAAAENDVAVIVALLPTERSKGIRPGSLCCIDVAGSTKKYLYKLGNDRVWALAAERG